MVQDIEDFDQKGRWKRISSPISELAPEYDVVVIGSGYGGGIAASRMARAGRKVCVLERGKEFLPGDFPKNALEGGLALHGISDPDGASPQIVGDPLGLMEVRHYPEVNVVLGCGLGGTSLINANVAMMPTLKVLTAPQWPLQLREEFADGRMSARVEKATKMLGVSPYPDDYPAISKLDMLQRASRAFDADYGPGTFQKTPIAVTFGDDPKHVNHVGVLQPPCNGCGNCCSGCNYGSKNTVAMNYLPDAHNFGAKIFCKVKVSQIKRANDGKWIVYYDITGFDRGRFTNQLMWVRAQTVFVAAGTLGSTEIMLRSKEHLPMSSQVGQCYSGNGDTLAFSYDTALPCASVGCEPGLNPEDHIPVGPCITGIIDLRHKEGAPADDGLIIEDGVAPGLTRPALTAVLPFLAANNDPNVAGGAEAAAAAAWAVETAMDGPVGSPGGPLFRPPLRAAALARRQSRHVDSLQYMETFLVMSHDRDAEEPANNNGVMTLYPGGRALCLRWQGLSSLPNYVRNNECLQRANEALEGVFIPNPLWKNGRDAVSVHSLGGCIMADDATQGVVNSKCQVFSGKSGTEVHEGLYVCDGAVIPRSLGINPFLTISAVAERTLELAAADRGWTVSTAAMPLDGPPAPDASTARGIRFTETMRGYVSTATQDSDTDLELFKTAEAAGKAANAQLQFTLTVVCDDIGQLLEDTEFKSKLVGTVNAVNVRELGDRTLLVDRGEFVIFSIDGNRAFGRRMKYSMRMHTDQGDIFYFQGFKEVGGQSPLEIWPDTTTLFTRIWRGDKPEGVPLYMGVLRISPADLWRQLQTIDTVNTRGLHESLRVKQQFISLFAGAVLESFDWGLLGWRRIFRRHIIRAPPFKPRMLTVGPPQREVLETADGKALRLTYYLQPGSRPSKGAVLLGHGLGVSSLIFALPTIDQNLLEAIYAAGFDVYLLELRVSILLPTAQEACTLDDVARFDWPAAVEAVKRLSGRPQVHIVAHCVGALTLSGALLAGHVSKSDVRSVTLSQATPLARQPLFNRLKAWLRAPQLFQAIGVTVLDVRNTGGLFNFALQKLLVDPAAWLVKQGGPDPSPVSRKITFTYGSLYKIDNLDRHTYNLLPRMFGGANMTTLQHLALVCRRGQLVEADGRNSYWTDANKVNFALPTLFLHGAENQCYLPSGSQLTMEALSQTNGPQCYSREIVRGYGHIDCIFGKHASRDVFPRIVKHLADNA